MCIICDTHFGCGHTAKKTIPCSVAFIGCNGMVEGGFIDLPLEICPNCKFGNCFSTFTVGEQNPFANQTISHGFGGFGIPSQGRQWGSYGESLVDEEQEDSQSQFWDSSDESAAEEDEPSSHHDQFASENSKVNSAALERYLEVFPNGHQIIPTPGNGLLCGFHAVILSMEAMDPDLARPTVEELQVVFKSLDNAAFGLDNEDYFHVDQVGAALYFWGTKYDMNLQVGYIPLGESPVLVPHPNEDETTVIFIQHAPGHFSGLRPNKAVHARKVSHIAFQPVKEDSEDDMVCD